MQIRQFEWSDYAAVTAVWAAAGREVVPRTELTAKLTRDPELFLVAESDSEVVGVVMGTYDGRRGWILRLAVHPDHRRRGVAGALVRELESRFETLGCPRVNLLVMPDNESGLRFWQALGYVPYPDVLCSKPMRSRATETSDRPGDPVPRRPGDPATRRPGDPATRRPGDPVTR